MKTKIVYVVVSNDSDVYLEQAWVSAFSTKYHNPGAEIVIVTDEDTYNGIMSTSRKQICDVVDGIVPICVDVGLSNMQRSRWIKTNLRNLIDGDFLFIDTDTVVTGDLSEVDEWGMDVGAVRDLHCTFDVFPTADIIKKKLKNVFDCVPSPATEYFNSGTLYVKDTDVAHRFFIAWHSNWLHSCDCGVFTDQLSLMKTCNDLPGIITPVSGDYNCQVLGSIQYLYTAKIMHFFNAKWNDNALCPFFSDDLYQSVKQNNCINQKVENIILHCRQYFASPSIPISGNDVYIWNSPAFTLLRWAKVNNRVIYNLLIFISRCILFIIKIIGFLFVNKYKKR